MILVNPILTNLRFAPKSRSTRDNRLMDRYFLNIPLSLLRTLEKRVVQALLRRQINYLVHQLVFSGPLNWIVEIRLFNFPAVLDFNSARKSSIAFCRHIRGIIWLEVLTSNRSILIIAQSLRLIVNSPGL